MVMLEIKSFKYKKIRIKALIGSVLIRQPGLKIRIGPVWVDASIRTKIFGLVWSGFRL
uniref:Uncharacterized protein n=1 Tax=Rhizophagus irregularis (strain DAOM 181602 / DAOM 197198 / MUCL 43194) TaxID=747089 RepID=U9TRF9_RHIID